MVDVQTALTEKSAFLRRVMSMHVILYKYSAPMLQAAPIGQTYQTLAGFTLSKHPSLVASKARLGVNTTTSQDDAASVVTYSLVADTLANVHSISKVLIPTED